MPSIKIRIGGEWVDINQHILDEAKNYTDLAIGDLNDYIDSAFKDGVIKEAEAKKIQSYIHNLEVKKQEVDKEYEELYNNPLLMGADKVNLATAKENHDATYNALIETINNVIADGVASPEETTEVDNAFTDYKNDLSVYKTMVERARQSIENVRAGNTLDEAKTYTDQQVQDSQNYIDTAFKDGIIEDTEYRVIKQYLNTLQSDKNSYDNKYNELYNNPQLTGTPKTNLFTTKQDLDAKYNALIEAINNAIADQKASDTERADVDAKFVEYNNQLSLFVAACEEATDAIHKNYTDQQVTDIQNYVDGAFKDGVIQDSEYRVIQQHLNTLQTQKNDFDNSYSQVYNNTLLTGTAKTNLQTAKQDLDTSYNNLINSINSAIADQKVTDTEKADVDSKFADYSSKIASFVSALEAAKDFIHRNYTDQQVQNTQTYVDGAFKDGVIQESEAKVIQQYLNTLQAQKNNFDNQYNQVYNNPQLTGTPKTDLQTAKQNLDTSYNNLVNSINTAIADGKATDAEKADVDAKFSDYNSKIASFISALEVAKNIVNQNYTDGRLQTTGPQLIKNSSFKAYDQSSLKPNLWSYVDSQFTVDTTTLLDGCNSLKIIVSGNPDSNTYYSARANSIKIRGGETFTVSTYIRTDNLSSFNVAGSGLKIGLYTTDSNGNMISWLASPVYVPTQVNTWERVTYTVTVPSNQNITDVYFQFRFHGNGRLWMAKPMCQPGSVATPWHEYVPDIINNWIYQGTTLIDGANIKTGTISFDQAFGGQIKLGGAAYGNASLYMYTDTGDTMVQIDANNRGFDYLNVGRIYSAYIVTRDPDLFGGAPITLYVDPVNGDDNNDGLTTNTQKKTIQGTLNSLPKYLDQDVTIQVKAGSGTINEYLTIHGFYGRGNLNLNFVGFSNTLIGKIEIYNCGSQIGISNLKIAYPQLNTSGEAVIYIHNSSVSFYNCQVYGRNVAQSCIRGKYGARIRCQEVSFFDATYGLDMQYASIGVFNNTYGNPSYYAAAFGAEVLCYGTRANGYPYAREGGAILWNGASEPTSGTAGSYNPPYSGSTPTQTTTQFTPTGGDSWRTVYNSWRRDGSVIQGQWGGYGLHRGYYFFGTNVSSAVTGKTIISMRVFIKRKSSGGISGDVPIYIRHHSLTALPADNNQPSVSSEYAMVKLGWGEYAWVTLPSSFYSYFQNGTAKGICVYTSDTSNNGYAILDPSNMILEITYQ